MAGDQCLGADRVGIGVSTELIESGREQGSFVVEKWDTDQINWTRSHDYDQLRLLAPGQEPDYRIFDKYNCLPYQTYAKEDCNLITAAGWNLCLKTNNWITTGGGSVSSTWFTTLAGRVGLGTSSVTPTYNDTALGAIGALTIANWIVCGAIPTLTSATGSTPASLVFTATFGTTQANGVPIAEFAIDQGVAASAALTTASIAPMVNHGLASPGTKTSAQTWNVTVTLTFT